MVININTQEAASTSTPPSASPSALESAPPNPSIVHQPLPEHSGLGGAGTSRVHSIFSSGSAAFVVDPSDLIQHIFEPISSFLYHAALAGFESGIHMIRLDAKPERAAANPTMQPEAQSPICLQARPLPEPTRPSLQHPLSLHRPANTLAAPLELAARAPLVVNLSRDAHRVPYDSATEMCA